MGEIEQSAVKSAFATAAGRIVHAWRWAIIPVAVIGAVPALTFATGGGGALMAALADPLSVLAARSPGARPAGALTQSKPRREPNPAERVLAEALTRPTGAPAFGDFPAAPFDIGAPDLPFAGPESLLPVVDVAGAPAPIGGGIYPGPGISVTPDVSGPGGGGGGGGSGGGGGGGGTSGETPVPPITPPVASVPEPGTWLTLVLGFGAVGGGLRSARRRTAPRRTA